MDDHEHQYDDGQVEKRAEHDQRIEPCAAADRTECQPQRGCARGVLLDDQGEFADVGFDFHARRCGDFDGRFGLSRHPDVAQHVDHARHAGFPLFGDVVTEFRAFRRAPREIGQDSVGDACHEYDEKRNVNDQQALQERFFVLHV